MSNEDEKNLNELEKKYIEAGSYGMNLQKQGNKIVRASEEGKEIVFYLKKQKHLIGTFDVSGWISAANATLPAHPPENLGDMWRYSASLSASNTSGTVVLHKVYDSGSVFNSSGLDKKPYMEFINNSYAAKIDELDNYLKKFKEEFQYKVDLSAMRKGAWDTFYSSPDTSVISAAHLMRDILTKIIAELAPNEKVKLAKWWAKPEGKDNPDERQRLRYLIFGSELEDDSDFLKMIYATIEECYRAHDKLKAVAKGSRELKEEVKAAMRITELTILTILEARESKKK